MKKFILIIAVAFAFLASVNLKAQFQDLDNDMYLEINNYNDLYTLSQNEAYWALWFELTADIQIPSGQNFNPIGNITTPFTGRLDGHHYKIIGATINQIGDCIGLFGINHGRIIDLVICNFDVTGNNHVGALCGLNGGLISGCEIFFDEDNDNYSATTVTGNKCVGGMVGGNWDTLTYNIPTHPRLLQYTYVIVEGKDTVGGFVGDNNSYDANLVEYNEIYNVQVNGTDDGFDIGGFVGYNNMSMSNCIVNGISSVNEDYSTQRVGGFVGFNEGNIQNCTVSVTSEVNAMYSNYVGGFAGKNTSSISQSTTGATVEGNRFVGGFMGYSSGWGVTNCTSNCVVTAYDNYVGVFVGQTNSGSISNCYVSAVNYILGVYSDYVGGFAGYNAGTISLSCTKAVAVAGDDCVGGFVGYNNYEIRNCYSRSNVTSVDVAGGFVGVNYSSGSIINCFSACGSISGYNPGGFAGLTITGTYTNCYWDAQLCGNWWSDGGTALTTAQSKNSFYYQLWDFNLIWEINLENNGYPSFRSVPIYKINLARNESNIDIYPNPVTDVSTIKINEPEMSFTTISVYNINGEKLETLYSGDITTNDYTINFDGNKYTSGMYYMMVESNNNRITKPIVIKH